MGHSMHNVAVFREKTIMLLVFRIAHLSPRAGSVPFKEVPGIIRPEQIAMPRIMLNRLAGA